MKFFRIFITAIIVVAALAYINIVLLPQPKQAQANVTAYYDSDVCGQLKVLDPTPGKDITESPSCTAGGTATSHVNDYQTTVTVYNSSDHDITGNFGWDEYWCNYDSGNSCGGNGNPKETTYHRTNGADTIPAHQSVTFKSSDNHPVGDGFSYCGVYQHDFTFSYQDSKTKQSCNPGNPKTGKSFYTMDWGVCRAGTGTDAKCYPATPTPTPTSTPTPTPTPTSTPTPSVTPSVTPTPTTPPPPQLVVIKEVHNNHGGTKAPADFMIHVDGNNASPSDFPGPEYPLWVNISAGYYSVTEQQLPGYTLVSQNGCSGYIQDGQIVNCTLVNEDIPASLTVVKVVNNNHGGTKQPADFPLYVNGTHVTTGVANTENPGDYTVAEDKQDGYHLVSISGACDSNGHVHLNPGDNKTCVIENEDNGGGACTMPTCNTNISGCSYPYPDTTTCSCGPLVCVTQTPSQPNITINNNNNPTINVSQQQQQQQAVLAASVAPASNVKSLPSTGAGAEVLLSLFGLLPIGWKLRKLV